MWNKKPVKIYKIVIAGEQNAFAETAVLETTVTHKLWSQDFGDCNHVFLWI